MRHDFRLTLEWAVKGFLLNSRHGAGWSILMTARFRIIVQVDSIHQAIDILFHMKILPAVDAHLEETGLL